MNAVMLDAALVILSYRGLGNGVEIVYPVLLQGRKRPTLLQKAEAVQEVMGAVNQWLYSQGLCWEEGEL